VPANDYHFVTRWTVEGTIEDVAAVIGDPLELPRWWPSVYLDVREVAPGDERGVGRTVELFTKGWLPYTLRWRFTITDSNRPHGLALAASGDFVGRGVWSFVQDGPCVRITYDWRITAEKPLLRRLSFLLKPLFAANHRWAMRMGERSLQLELRRRALPDARRIEVPLPPDPTRLPLAPLAAVVAGIGGLAGLALLRGRLR